MNSIVESGSFTEHPYRKALYDEIHNRPFPPVVDSISVSRLAVVTGDSSKEQRIRHLTWLAEQHHTKAPPVDAVLRDWKNVLHRQATVLTPQRPISS